MVFISSVAKSQSTFGVKAGVNFANQEKTIPWIEMEEEIPLESRYFIGYQLGTFYKIKLPARFWLSIEANFSVIGSTLKLAGPGGTIDNKVHEKLGYIEFPLTLQYSVNKLYFGVGPSLSLRLFSRFANTELETVDIPYYQETDVAATFLAGYNLSKKWDINARYSHGLNSI